MREGSVGGRLDIYAPLALNSNLIDACLSVLLCDIYCKHSLENEFGENIGATCTH